jgi:hypothetical protein
MVYGHVVQIKRAIDSSLPLLAFWICGGLWVKELDGFNIDYSLHGLI